MSRYTTHFVARGDGQDDTPGDGDGDESGLGDPKPPKTVAVLGIAKAEGREILTDVQYCHVVDLAKRLCDFGNRPATADLRISKLGNFWALKIKGGFLGKINLRVYFAYVEARNEIVILMTYKKEEERRVSPHVLVTLEDRLEDYLSGARRGISVYQRRYR